jgi:hypothetical protein
MAEHLLGGLWFQDSRGKNKFVRAHLNRKKLSTVAHTVIPAIVGNLK